MQISIIWILIGLSGALPLAWLQMRFMTWLDASPDANSARNRIQWATQAIEIAFFTVVLFGLQMALLTVPYLIFKAVVTWERDRTPERGRALLVGTTVNFVLGYLMALLTATIQRG